MELECGIQTCVQHFESLNITSGDAAGGLGASGPTARRHGLPVRVPHGPNDGRRHVPITITITIDQGK